MLPPVWIEGGSWDHLLGTDGNGRDYLSRILSGTRISLTIGIGAALVGMVIGVTLGVIAGYFGGWIDQFVNYILTCQLALPKLQIIIQDILPGIINQIIVIFTLEVGVAILAEASLSFLGVGIQPPTPSWGLLIAEGKEAIFFQPWLIVLPGIALFLLVVSINMLGDGLRDIMDPKSKLE